MTKTSHNLVFFSFLLFYWMLSNPCLAQPKLAALFTDGMVLQQNSKVKIWGWDKPSTSISLTSSWNKQSYKAVAGPDGKFVFNVTTNGAGGPYSVNISDGQSVVLNNVLIGEVWVCTGQSNMEMPVKGFKGQPVYGSFEAIQTSKNSSIRLFTVPRSSQVEPQNDIKASKWLEAGPESVSEFSATGYYFGLLLNKMLNVPIGLINCSYGGSAIQAWMDAKSLGAYPEIKVPNGTDPIKQPSQTPTVLYNGMLHPVTEYGIKGVIWYQGESNYENAAQYQKLLVGMVSAWRSRWGLGDFPFYYAQIAPYDYARRASGKKGGKYNSAFLRDAQRLDEELIPNSGMAVLMDVGEQRTIHPPNKAPVGTRLAYLALGKTYGIKGFGYESPKYDRLIIRNDTAVVTFKNPSNGLTSKFINLSTFEIAGADKHFYQANAQISGRSVNVTSPQVKTPVAVRYAFHDFTVGELFGSDGLPVSSFRTDNWDYDDK